MTLRSIFQNIAFAGAAAAGLYESCGPNTAYDKLTAKHLWCGPSVTRSVEEGILPEKPYVSMDVESLKKDQRDDDFVRARQGDILKYGKIELRVTDSRPQEVHWTPNKLRDMTEDAHRVQVGCPGYIKFDVYHNGQIVPEGKGIEIAYAAKFWGGTGGLFDGWPDFSLEEVLEMTGLGSDDVEKLLVETAEIKRREYEELEKERRQAVGKKRQAGKKRR